MKGSCLVGNSESKYYKINDYSRFKKTLKLLGTQEKIAENLDVEPKTVSNWYTEKTHIGSWFIEKLKKIYKLDLENIGAVEYIPTEREKILITFSKNLNYIMKKKNIRPNDIINSIGVSKDSISKWRNGSTIPKLETMKRLAKYLNVSLDYLLTDTKLEKMTVEEFLLEIGLNKNSYEELKKINKAPIIRPLFYIPNRIKDFNSNEILNYIIQCDLTQTFKEQIMAYHIANTNSKSKGIGEETKHEQKKEEILDVLNKKVEEIFYLFYQNKVKDIKK